MKDEKLKYLSLVIIALGIISFFFMFVMSLNSFGTSINIIRSSDSYSNDLSKIIVSGFIDGIIQIILAFSLVVCAIFNVVEYDRERPLKRLHYYELLILNIYEVLINLFRLIFDGIEYYSFLCLISSIISTVLIVLNIYVIKNNIIKLIFSIITGLCLIIITAMNLIQSSGTELIFVLFMMIYVIAVLTYIITVLVIKISNEKK